MFLSPDADAADGEASTIEKEGSDHELDAATAEDAIPAAPAAASPATEALESRRAEEQARDDELTPRQSGSPRKRISLQSGAGGDPHIGLNVITTAGELDTLAYSRDPDESTLLTSDAFSRRYGGLGSGGKRKPFLERLFSSDEAGADPPYLLVCLGLGVGIGLCAMAALAYVEYASRHSSPGVENVTSPEGTWRGVPYAKIGRESFGDPVEDIFDVRPVILTEEFLLVLY